MTTKSLLKYRNIWMGIAMLWIVWFHSNLYASFTPLEHLRLIGYGGVDICLFASGAGCYLSLCRDSDPFRFMKRRIARLYPTYICFIPFWLLFMSTTGDMSVSAIIGNLLGIQNFTGLGNDFNWYVSAILLFYLLTPLFKSFLDQTDSIRMYLALTLLLITISLPFHNVEELLVTATRLPIYFLGMLLGKLCFQSASLSKPVIVGSLAASASGIIMMNLFFKFFAPYLQSWGLYWYPFILIAPGMCIAISLIAEKAVRYALARPLIRVLDIIGQYSFEIYLVHILVFDIRGYLNISGMVPENTPYVWLLSFASIIAGSLVLRLCVRTAEKLYAALQRSYQSRLAAAHK